MARLLALLVLVSFPALAGSKGDWFASLYTGEGIELRNDERVFALFALFNAMGFDQGPVTRKDPIPKVIYHPVRQLVRGRVIGGDPEVRKAAEAFLDAHPTALRRYLSYAVASGQPPFTTGATTKDLQELKGFEQVLNRAWTGWKLDEVMGAVQGDYRKVLRSYLAGSDFPINRARVLLKVPETTETLIVVNLLDAQDQVRAVRGESGEAFLVVGPSDEPNVEGVIREFARLWVEPAVAKQVSKWTGGLAVLREAQLAGAGDQSLQDYATTTISTAIALRAIDASEAAFDAANSHGYYGVKDISRLFDDGKALDAIVLDAMMKIEPRRTLKK